MQRAESTMNYKGNWEFFDYLTNIQGIDYKQAQKDARAGKSNTGLFNSVAKLNDDKFILMSSVHFIMVII